jgi:glycosyltransferase involved in cell wall biosynthesis
MKKPLFSIIVPAYNEEKTIRQCLRSLKGQTFRDFEIIVVNNNSTDKTAEIAKKEVKKVLLEKKQGYIYAVNRGAREAKGEFISFADADSFYPADWLLKAAKWIEKKPHIVGLYGTTKFYDYNPIFNFLSWLTFSVFLHFSKLLGHHNTAGFNFIMRRKIYFQVGGYNPKIYNSVGIDMELGLRLARHGELVLDTSSFSYTSSRRYKKNGLIKTTWMFLDAWLRLHFGKKQKIDYSQYNKERR